MPWFSSIRSFDEYTLVAMCENSKDEEMTVAINN